MTVAAACACAGCRGQPEPEALNGPDEPRPRVAIPTSSTDPQATVEATGDTLGHDFGLVQPGEKVSHRFAVRNDSPKTWTFQRFHVNCSCTVGQASAPAVLPGKTEYVEVLFTAPAAQIDERRKVGVQFAEDHAPFLWLEVSARVRDPICVMPPQFVFNRIGHGRTVEGTFEVHNYEDRDIENNQPRPKAVVLGRPPEGAVYVR
jgi:uncharacterized protein DUF1573